MLLNLVKSVRSVFDPDSGVSPDSSPALDIFDPSSRSFDGLFASDSSFNNALQPYDARVNAALGSAAFLSGGAQSAAASVVAPPPTFVSSPTSALEFKLVWDASVAGAGASEAPFMNAVENAAQYYANNFSSVSPSYTPANALLVTIDVGYGEVMGSSLPFGAVSASSDNGDFISYNAYYNALRAAVAVNPSPDPLLNAYVANHLPTPAQFTTATGKDPNATNMFVTYAEEKSLGITPAYTYGQPDGWIGIAKNSTGFFGTPMNYTADANLNVTGAISGYDAVGAAAHEISEVLGRVGGLGATLVSGTGATWTPLDLSRYTGSGALDLTTKKGYFSVDGGATDLANYNTSYGDSGDWASSSPTYDSYGFYSKNHSAPISATDLLEVASLGFQLTTTGNANAGSPKFV